MNVESEVLAILDEVLVLNGRTASMNRDSPVLGALPELDSIAVVSVITALENRFAVSIGEDELTATSFATVGSIADLVSSKTPA
jgi:acyl carrier protein